MKVKLICEQCRKISEDPKGWYAPDWMGWMEVRGEVLKVGVCPECLKGV